MANKFQHFIEKLKHIIKGYDIVYTVFSKCVATNLMITHNNIYTSSDDIIKFLVKYKQDKIKFIIDTHNKFIKYNDFALEECDISMKLLLSIGSSGQWSCKFDEMVNKIIHTDIQRHKYFISSQIFIPCFDVIFDIITYDMIIQNLNCTDKQLRLKYQHNEILCNMFIALNWDLSFFYRINSPHGFHYATSVPDYVICLWN
jgi:hypothetical protein